jgi:hypothetical protein
MTVFSHNMYIRGNCIQYFCNTFYMIAIKAKAKPQFIIIIIIIIIIDILQKYFSWNSQISLQFTSLCSAKGTEVNVTSLSPTLQVRATAMLSLMILQN